MKSSFKLIGLNIDSDKKLNQSVVEVVKERLLLPSNIYVTYKPDNEIEEIYTPIEAVFNTDRVTQYLKVDYSEVIDIYSNEDNVLDLDTLRLESNVFLDNSGISLDVYSVPVTRKMKITFTSPVESSLSIIKDRISKGISISNSIPVTYPIGNNVIEFLEYLRKSKANKVTPDTSWNTIDKYFPIENRQANSNCFYTGRVTRVGEINYALMYTLDIELEIKYNHCLWLIATYPPILNNTLINPIYLVTDVNYTRESKEQVKEIGKGHIRNLIDPRDTFNNVPMVDDWFTSKVNNKFTPLVTILLTVGNDKKSLGKLDDLKGIKITPGYLKYMKDTNSGVTKSYTCVFRLDLFEDDDLYSGELTLASDGKLTTSTNLNYSKDYRLVLSLIKDISSVEESEFTKLLSYLEPDILEFKNNNKNKHSNLLTYDDPEDNGDRVYDVKGNALVDKDNDAVTYSGTKLKDLGTIRVDTAWIESNNNALAKPNLPSISKLELPKNYHTGIAPKKVQIAPDAYILPGVQAKWNIAKPTISINGNVEDINSMDGKISLTPYRPLFDYPGVRDKTEWVFDNGYTIQEDDDEGISNLFDKPDLLYPGSIISVKARYKSFYLPAPRNSDWSDTVTYQVPRYGIQNFSITLVEKDNKSKLEIKAPFTIQTIHPVGNIAKVKSILTILDLATESIFHTETKNNGTDSFTINTNILTDKKTYSIRVKHEVSNTVLEHFGLNKKYTTKVYTYDTSVEQPIAPAIDTSKWAIEQPVITFDNDITLETFNGILNSSTYRVKHGYPGEYDQAFWVVKEDDREVFRDKSSKYKDKLDLTSKIFYKPNTEYKIRLKHISNLEEYPSESNWSEEFILPTPNFGVKQPNLTIEESSDKEFIVLKYDYPIEEWNTLGIYTREASKIEIKDLEGNIILTRDNVGSLETRISKDEIPANKPLRYKITHSISGNDFYIRNNVHTNATEKEYTRRVVFTISNIEKPILSSTGYIASDYTSFNGILEVSKCKANNKIITPTSVEWARELNNTALESDILTGKVDNKLELVNEENVYDIAVSYLNLEQDNTLKLKARYNITEHGETISSEWSEWFTLKLPSPTDSNRLRIEGTTVEVKQLKAGEDGSSVTADKYSFTDSFSKPNGVYGNFYGKLKVLSREITVYNKLTNTLVKSYTIEEPSEEETKTLIVKEDSSFYLPRGKEYLVKVKTKVTNSFLSTVSKTIVSDLEIESSYIYDKATVEISSNWKIKKPTFNIPGYSISNPSTLKNDVISSVYEVEDSYPGLFSKAVVKLTSQEDGTNTVNEFNPFGTDHIEYPLRDLYKNPIIPEKVYELRIKYESDYTRQPLSSEWSEPFLFKLPELGIKTLTGSVTKVSDGHKVTVNAEMSNMPTELVGEHELRGIEVTFTLDDEVKYFTTIDNNGSETIPPEALEDGEDYQITFKATINNDGWLDAKELAVKEYTIEYRTSSAKDSWNITTPTIEALPQDEDILTWDYEVNASEYTPIAGYPGEHDSSLWDIVREGGAHEVELIDTLTSLNLKDQILDLHLELGADYSVCVKYKSEYEDKPITSARSNYVNIYLPDAGLEPLEPEVTLNADKTKLIVKSPFKYIQDDILPVSGPGTRKVIVTRKDNQTVLTEIANDVNADDNTPVEIPVTSLVKGVDLDISITHTSKVKYIKDFNKHVVSKHVNMKIE